MACQWASMAWKYQRVASTVLYSGAAPESGKRFGSMPSLTWRAKLRRIRAATSDRPRGSVSPGSAIMVSRPQSPNQW